MGRMIGTQTTNGSGTVLSRHGVSIRPAYLGLAFRTGAQMPS